MTTDLRPDALRTALSCEVILDADEGFDEARAIFNATIDRRPVAIVRPRSTDEVVAAVRWARDAGLPIAVRGGGTTSQVTPSPTVPSSSISAGAGTSAWIPPRAGSRSGVGRSGWTWTSRRPPTGWR